MLYEIHTETYEVEPFEVIEAKDAYAAAIAYAGRFSPCTIRRTHPEIDGDTFVILALGTTGDGIELEVFEHDPELV